VSLSHVYGTFRDFVDSSLRPVVNAAAGAAVPMFLDNQDIESVNSGPWIKITALPGSHTQQTTGANTNTFRKTGAFVFSMFDDFGSGDERVVGIVDAVLEHMLANMTVGGVVYSPGTPVRVGRAGKFYQMNITLLWQYDTRA